MSSHRIGWFLLFLFTAAFWLVFLPIVAVFYSIVLLAGGFIAYRLVHDDNPRMVARTMMLSGGVMVVLIIILFLVVLILATPHDVVSRLSTPIQIQESYSVSSSADDKLNAYFVQPALIVMALLGMIIWPFALVKNWQTPQKRLQLLWQLPLFSMFPVLFTRGFLGQPLPWTLALMAGLSAAALLASIFFLAQSRHNTQLAARRSELLLAIMIDALYLAGAVLPMLTLG